MLAVLAMVAAGVGWMRWRELRSGGDNLAHPGVLRHERAGVGAAISGVTSADDAAPIAWGPIHFTEMTRESGVDFVHGSGDSADKPFPAANGSGVAAFDFDLDGSVDLYFLT